MPSALVLAIFLSLSTMAPSPCKLTGVWVLNRDQSDFGALDRPLNVLMRVEPGDEGLEIWEITTTLTDRHITHRHLNLHGTNCTELPTAARDTPSCWIEPDGGGTEENWQLSQTGELVIRRDVRIGYRTVPQRLVLEPSHRFSH